MCNIRVKNERRKIGHSALQLKVRCYIKDTSSARQNQVAKTIALLL